MSHTTTTVSVRDTTEARLLAAALVRECVAFEFTPLPDDECEFRVLCTYHAYTLARLARIHTTQFQKETT